MSNAMARLRVQLGDELFLRGPGRLRPTARAAELAPLVHTILEDLKRTLDPPGFDPTTARHTFVVATNDYFTAVVAPELAHIIAEEAPLIDVRIIPTAARAFELLDEGRATSYAPPPPRLRRVSAKRS